MDAPEAFIPKARYALEALLTPLSIEPAWVDEGESADLVYGTGAAITDSAIHLPLHADTLALFEAPTREVETPSSSISLADGTYPVLFGSSGEPDLIASSFYLLSGWQEVATRARDEYGRYRFAGSLQERLGTAALPLVDVWRDALAGRLEQRGHPARRRDWDGHEWAMLPTFDVDYLRRLRPGVVWRELRRPANVLRELLEPRDPYLEGVHNLMEALRRVGVAGTFFFKGQSRSAFDPPYGRSNGTVRGIVREVLEGGSEVGVHPGYYASSHEGMLDADRRSVENLAGEPIVSVRQHYLRYEHPATPRLHHRAGFRIDSSLGFSEQEGFRRGTCLPFPTFDVLANRVLDVWEMPLAFMDVAAAVRRAMSAAESTDVAHALMDTTRRFGGAFVVLWHNTLWHEEMAGWPGHLEAVLRYAIENGAFVGSLRHALASWLRQADGPLPTRVQRT